MSSQVFEYSKLFLQFGKWCKLSNGLDDFKEALYICPNHIDIDIHSDHGYLDTLEQPSGTTLRKNFYKTPKHAIFDLFISIYTTALMWGVNEAT